MKSKKQNQNKLDKDLSKKQIKKTHLEEELSKLYSAVFELKVLNELAVAATKVSSSEQMLDLIINKCINAINAEQGSILKVSKSEDKIVSTLVRQQDNSKLKHKYNVTTNIAGWVLLNKNSIFIEELSTDDRFKTTKEECKYIHSVICIPIWHSGEIIGIMIMVNKKGERKFNSTDLDLLSIIAIQAGQLIKNVQLREEALIKSKEAEIARVEKEKIAELDELKSRFFANISHEFRTPLTLIQGPAEKIISDTSDNIKKDAGFIKKNSARLLQLVNQLLDLSKLNAGKLKLETSNYNIVSFVKGIVLSFESLSEEKDITLKIITEKDLIEVYFDREKMIKILSNILSNAFKFTPQDGKITIAISTKSPFAKGGNEEGSVEIKIRDTGIGIPQEEIPKLFDRFYQVDSSFTKEYQGTGIGLALTKELVELHHGSISVRSEKANPAGKAGWTEFILNFPLGRNHLKDEEILVEEEIKTEEKEDPKVITHLDSSSQAPQNDFVMEEDKTIVLIVEDNYDMREYIKESIGEDYFVEEAINGEQGIRKAENIIPDLIISDMMMPKMDGNEMTKILKNDEKTSHIPIIILTAKSGQESKLEGLETGADDYLTKPFDIKELQVRIKNLINIRRKLQERFSKIEISPSSKNENESQSFSSIPIKLRSIDEKFVSKIQKIISERISDESFSTEELGNEVGMSRSQVFRKIKALTGKSPSTYVRSIRLLKAKGMIESGEGNISEIAYSVGFSSPIYFSKCFKDEFGYPPKNLIL